MQGRHECRFAGPQQEDGDEVQMDRSSLPLQHVLQVPCKEPGVRQVTNFIHVKGFHTTNQQSIGASYFQQKHVTWKEFCV